MSIYLPKHFQGSDDKALLLMDEYPFATLISIDDEGAPFISHLPLILLPATDSEPRVLIGHMAKQNPQWRHFKTRPQATAVFHGPHAYITPKWYSSGRDVPTWNYAVCHAKGRVELIEDFKGLIDILIKTTARFEDASQERFQLPEDLRGPEQLTSAIVGFKITIESLEAKFKLSQNRGEADRKGVIAGLTALGDDQSLSLAKLMTETSKK